MATNISLGRLEKVVLRETWPTEAMDFTPWLAQEENLSLLGETLGIELELEAQEKNVGPFRADILCKDTLNGHWVLIENQIERTDHTHLGQLLTYAAGLKAVTIVWVAAEFTDEHRAALDWLNEVTNEGINFFGLEIELWKIDDSLAAPKFNIVSRPNDWTETVANATRRMQSSDISDTQRLYLEHWGAFSEFLSSKGSSVKTQKPLAQNWTNVSIGRTGFVLYVSGNLKRKRATVGLALTGNSAKDNFFLLMHQKDEIEQDFGLSLDWREQAGGKESRIDVVFEGADLRNKDCWNEHFLWYEDMLKRFDRAFRQRIKNLKDIEFVSSEGGETGELN